MTCKSSIYCSKFRYNQMLFWNYKIYVGKYDDKEVDFVCIKNNKTIYIQVTQSLNDKKVIEREFGNLLLIKDNYPKIVVSMDEFIIDSYKGVNHINLRNFLMLEEDNL